MARPGLVRAERRGIGGARSASGRTESQAPRSNESVIRAPPLHEARDKTDLTRIKSHQRKRPKEQASPIQPRRWANRQIAGLPTNGHQASSSYSRRPPWADYEGMERQGSPGLMPLGAPAERSCIKPLNATPASASHKPANMANPGNHLEPRLPLRLVPSPRRPHVSPAGSV